ncbi:MAG: helix-turn-helix domain-containing protein, partial [Actinomycetota bacterium]
MPLTVNVQVPQCDRQVLAEWAGSPATPAGLAQRARIVLLAADGLGTSEIVRLIGVSKPTVIMWKRRYAAEGIGGLQDRPKPGRPRQVDDAAIVLRTLRPPPGRPGSARWSSRQLAAELGVSNVTVADVWRQYGLRPWRTGPVTLTADPELSADVRDVAGLYLYPPDRAVVVQVAGEGGAAGGQWWPDRDQARWDPAGLVAALDAAGADAEGRDAQRLAVEGPGAAGPGLTAVAGAGEPRPRHEAFLGYLREVDAARPGQPLHILTGSCATSLATIGHPAVLAWLGRNPRVVLHSAVGTGSWLTLTEVFFGIIMGQLDCPASCAELRELMTRIEAFADSRDKQRRPFGWVAGRAAHPGKGIFLTQG